jgi:DNA (cytosine-5)-methyltransferase 1
MSLGFKQAGFKVSAAFDIEDRHVETYRINFPNGRAFVVDLGKATGHELRKLAGIGRSTIDVVFGGPPCQGFSVGGRRDETDARNLLLLDFARLVTELKPRYFVAENVEGLMRGYARRMVEEFCKIVSDCGYSVVAPIRILDAAEFGVPQRRRRTFILGHRKGVPCPRYPVPRGLVDERGREFRPTVRHAISDLPDVEEYNHLYEIDCYTEGLSKGSTYAKLLGDEPPHAQTIFPLAARRHPLTGCLRTRHSTVTVKRFQKTRPGRAEPISRYIRLALDDVAPTLRAGTASDKGSHTAPRPIHPTKARCITVREAARLHSFPDWFQFHATRWHAFRQIGNSVPPMMARAVAMAIFDVLARQRLLS